MGRNKAELIIDGEPLWQRQLRLLRQLKPKEIFFSVRPVQPLSPGLAELASLSQEIEIVLDEFPSRGPMSGIWVALSRMKTSHLLVLAIDMPFLLEKDLRHLVSLAKRGCGVVPAAGELVEPLAAIYPKESLPEFGFAVSSDDQSLQKLVKRLADLRMAQLLHLSPSDAERYRSVNTPDDLVARDLLPLRTS